MRKSKCLVEIKSAIMYQGMCYAPFYLKKLFFCEKHSPNVYTILYGFARSVEQYESNFIFW
jgi:hypothetical protein